MRTAIEQLDKEIKRVQNGYELTNYGEGYIKGIEFSKEIIQNNIDGLVVVGKTYFVILYRDGNVYQPYIKEMKLIDKIRTKWGYRYKFSSNLEAKSKFSQCDLEIGKPKEFRDRVFLDKKQAEKEIERRLKGTLI